MAIEIYPENSTAQIRIQAKVSVQKPFVLVVFNDEHLF